MSRLAAMIRPAPQGAAKSTKNQAFRPDIQGLRALAVTMVVIYHLFPKYLPGGFAGVDVFFVISGYLITGHLWRGYRSTGKVSLVDFWGRRAKRLIPAAALVLAVTWAGCRVLVPDTKLPDDAQQILASALYFQNWQLSHDSVDYLKSNDAATPVQHFWSLSVEEQFYLVWPLLFLLAALIAVTVTRAARRRAATADTIAAAPDAIAARTGRTRRAAVAALTTALVAGSLAYSIWDTGHDPAAAYFATTTRMWELGTGGLLALAPAGLTRVLSRQAWLAWAGLAAILASAFTLSGSSPFPGYLALLPVLGSAALIAGGNAQGPLATGRFMSTRPMVWLGGISYSLYLWHYPIISLFTTWHGKAPGLVTGPALAIAAVLIAWASKTWIEDPVRLATWLKGHAWRSAATAATAAIPVAMVLVSPGPVNKPLPATGYPGAAVMAAAHQHRAIAVPAEPVRPGPTQATEPDYWGKDGCLADQYATASKPCVFGDTTDPILTVALVGDSIAGNWWAPLNQIAKQEHWKLVTDLHGNCPWTATEVQAPATRTVPHPGMFPQCQAWGKSVLHDLLTSIHPRLVIATSRQAAIPGDTTAQANAAIGAGEAAYWNQLKAHGISVISILDSPNLGLAPPTCVQHNGAGSPACETPSSQAILPSAPALTATRITGVPLVNLDDLFCANGECPAVIGNVMVYFDNHHVTQQYGLTLTPYLKQRLLATGAVPGHPRN